MHAVKSLFTSSFRPRSIITIALIFWCAGAGCMMVSYARGAMSDENSSTPAAEHSMPMSAAMDAHACCKARHTSLALKHVAQPAIDINLREFTIPSPAPAGAMSCCPLTSGSIVVASRSQTNDSACETADTSASSLKLDNSHKPPVTVAPPRLPNRARSYLLDCAFLI
jgi:hypothetical protein